MVCPTEALNAEAITEKLKTLPQWQFRQNAIERVYVGETYLGALERLNAIARLSEAANHHPDLTLAWKTLTVRYWTHTAQGVTDLDFMLANQAEQVLNV